MSKDDGKINRRSLPKPVQVAMRNVLGQAPLRVTREEADKAWDKVNKKRSKNFGMDM